MRPPYAAAVSGLFRDGYVSDVLPRSTRLRNSRTSLSWKRRWPPRVRVAESLPVRAHRVTVLGLTRNICATSAGVRSALSASLSGIVGPRADYVRLRLVWTFLRSLGA